MQKGLTRVKCRADRPGLERVLMVGVNVIDDGRYQVKDEQERNYGIS